MTAIYPRKSGSKDLTSFFSAQTPCATENQDEIQALRWVSAICTLSKNISAASYNSRTENLYLQLKRLVCQMLTLSVIVQYLLILGQYLQGTQKSAQALSNHGLAITAAFRLGIHSPEANRGFSPLECEIRKRTWFGCVLLDRYRLIIALCCELKTDQSLTIRTLSMTFGRPCIIPQSYIRLEMPLLGVQMTGRCPQPGIHAHLDGCFFTAAM